jgi:multidrug resistance efflux pump
LKEKKSDLDYEGKNGVNFINDTHPEVRVEELEKDLREEKKQHFELSIKFDEMKAQLEELQKKLNKLETLKPQILDLDSLIENAPEGKLIQVSDETKEKINLKGKN